MSRSYKLTLFLAAAASALAASTAAFAETWKADAVLLPERSAGSCASAQTLPYTFTLNGSVLNVRYAAGNLGDTQVAPNGAVDFAYRSPNGASVRITGNAFTKNLVATNNNSGCSWKAVPQT